MPTAIVVSVVIGVLALVLGALIGLAIRDRRERARLAVASADAERLIQEAQTREKELLLEAKYEPTQNEIFWYTAESACPNYVSNQIHVSASTFVGGCHSF